MTNFVPLLTTAAQDAVATTTPDFSGNGLGFPPKFGPGFPGRFKPTGGSDSDDKKHRGSNGGNSTTSADDSNTNKGNSNDGKAGTGSKSLDPTAERALISIGSIGEFTGCDTE